MADLKYLTRKRLYTVIAYYDYEDGKQHYPQKNGKMYPAPRYVLEFVRQELAKAKRNREMAQKMSYRGIPYKVTFKIYESPLEWEETTEDWESELVLLALGGKA